MCGIIGVIGKDANEYVENNLNLLSKRGPDSQGIVHLSSSFSMGATRLAMTDPHPRSNQPLKDPKSGDIIIFNGEIYNYLKLKKQLKSAGLVFETESDTEVVLKSLTYYGESVIKNFEGMFAFAFYSSKQNKIILARDFLGKKPLFYSISSKFLIFSSQINLVKNYLDKTTLDESSVTTYLKFGYLMNPETMYTEIKSVSPGEMLEIDLNNIKIESRKIFTPLPISNPPEISIRGAILDAVEKRTSGHKNFALSLSGGIDSTIIGIECARLGLECHAYSMMWEESDKARYNQDFIAASAISGKLGLTFRPVRMPKITKLPDLITKYIEAMGEPNSNPTGVSMMSFYEQISHDGIRLLLTGDGSDEIFGGYKRYENINKLSRIPNNFSSYLSKLLLKSGVASDKFYRKVLINSLDNSWNFWSFWQQLRSDQYISKFYKASSFQTFPEVNVNFSDKFLSNSRLAHIMMKDLKIWLAMESNVKLDRVSMYWSIEARSPFQSETVIGLALDKMSETKYRSLNKGVLKLHYPELNHLPINRTKVGFISPLGHWLRSNTGMVEESISYIKDKFDFDQKELLNLIRSPQLGKYEDFRFLWSLIILARWHERQNG
jgi:asparagine synthase (glutamine-hydrolysing)